MNMKNNIIHIFSFYNKVDDGFVTELWSKASETSPDPN